MNKKDRIDNEILNLRNDIDNANVEIARLKIHLNMAMSLAVEIESFAAVMTNGVTGYKNNIKYLLEQING